MGQLELERLIKFQKHSCIQQIQWHNQCKIWWIQITLDAKDIYVHCGCAMQQRTVVVFGRCPPDSTECNKVWKFDARARGSRLKVFACFSSCGHYSIKEQSTER